MLRAPARVGVIVDGGTCRKPGPSLSGAEGFDGTGSVPGEITSPGSTRVAIVVGD